MAVIDIIKEKAKADKKTIVLPESMDRRTWEAAEKILKEGLANLIIIGTPEDIGEHSKGLDVSGATIINPQTYEKTQEYIDLFVELRKAKGMTPEKAKETILGDYAYYGCLMIKNGDADGMVSGACHSTANTLRPCLQVIKTKPGTKLVSAFFLMEVPDCDLGDNGTFVFADCGLNQNPNPEELAAIAVSSAESFKMLTGHEPKVAMLSHSSKGSAKHADVDKVVEAMSMEVRKYAEKLAKMANEETGFGKWQDKVIKNKFAAEIVYESIKGMKTIGILGEKDSVMDVAVPVGVVAGLIPSTNPTSTVIYKTLISLKAGNGIIISPHPNAKKCIIETVESDYLGSWTPAHYAPIMAVNNSGSVGTDAINSVKINSGNDLLLYSFINDDSLENASEIGYVLSTLNSLFNKDTVYTDENAYKKIVYTDENGAEGTITAPENKSIFAYVVNDVSGSTDTLYARTIQKIDGISTYGICAEISLG